MPTEVQTVRDPTGTTRVRERFREDVHDRYESVALSFRDELAASDIFDRDRAEAQLLVRHWMTTELDDAVVEDTRPGDVYAGDHWTATYIRDAHEVVLDRTRRILERGGADNVDAATNLMHPRHVDVRNDTYASMFADIDETTKDARKRAVREFVDGHEAGETPTDTVANVWERWKSHAIDNADAAVDNRIVDLSNRAALEAYEMVGVEDVAVAIESQPPDDDVTTNYHDHSHRPFAQQGYPATRVHAAGELEFTTAGDDLVCPQCAQFHGQTFRIEDIKAGDAPSPPLHPRCRCYWLPTEM